MDQGLCVEYTMIGKKFKMSADMYTCSVIKLVQCFSSHEKRSTTCGEAIIVDLW